MPPPVGFKAPAAHFPLRTLAEDGADMQGLAGVIVFVVPRNPNLSAANGASPDAKSVLGLGMFGPRSSLWGLGAAGADVLLQPFFAAHQTVAIRTRPSAHRRWSILTLQISDPAPLIFDYQPERPRRVRCIWFVGPGSHFTLILNGLLACP